jgi:hypothetical protein
LLTVENSHSDYQECDEAVESIVRFIINHKLAIK